MNWASDLPGLGGAMTELAQQQGQDQAGNMVQNIQGGTGFDPQQYAQHLTDMYSPQSHGLPFGAGANTDVMQQMSNMSWMSPDAEGKQSPHLMEDLYRQPGADRGTLDDIGGQEEKEEQVRERHEREREEERRQRLRDAEKAKRDRTRPTDSKPVLPPDQAPLFDENGNFISEEERARRYQEYTNPTSPRTERERILDADKAKRRRTRPTAPDDPNRYVSPDRSGPGYPEDPNAVDVPDVLTPIEEIDPAERISGVPGHAGPPMGGNTVGGGAPDAPQFPGYPHGPGQNLPPGFQIPPMPPRVTNPPVIFGPRENPFIGPMIPERQRRQMPINIDPLRRPVPQFPPQQPSTTQLWDLKNQAQMNEIYY